MFRIIGQHGLTKAQWAPTFPNPTDKASNLIRSGAFGRANGERVKVQLASTQIIIMLYLHEMNRNRGSLALGGAYRQIMAQLDRHLLS